MSKILIHLYLSLDLAYKIQHTLFQTLRPRNMGIIYAHFQTKGAQKLSND